MLPRLLQLIKALCEITTHCAVTRWLIPARTSTQRGRVAGGGFEGGAVPLLMLNRNISPSVIGNILIKQCVGSSLLHRELYLFPWAPHNGSFFINSLEIVSNFFTPKNTYVNKRTLNNLIMASLCCWLPVQCYCYAAEDFWEVVGGEKNTN